MRPLHPPLKVIEDKLFLPSDELLLRWVANDSSLSKETIRALENDPIAQNLYTDLKNPDNSAIEDDKADDSPPLPAFLGELIDKRIDAREKFANISVPSAGQILRLDKIVGKNGPINWDLPSPLTVLISEATETKNVWYGWMVASETDYASHWDMLLEPEDEPFDPYAAVIQIWNPVNIYIDSDAPVLAVLKPERLQAVRALAVEFATSSNEPDISLSQPGHIAPRTTFDNFSILTGSPISGNDDPRQRYQVLYHSAAKVLRDVAPSVVDELVPVPPKPENNPSRKGIFRFVFVFPIVLAISIIVIFIPKPHLNITPIDITNQSIIAQKTDKMVKDWREFTFIWEGDSPNSVGFSPTGEVSMANKAFSAGLLTARETLLDNKDFILPKPLLKNWAKTEWDSYFDLGRWTFLLWTASQVPKKMPADFWVKQQQIMAQFQTDFVKRQETDNEAKIVVYQLEERVQPFLDKLPSEEDEIYDNLGFGLEKVMMFLAN